MASWVLGCKNCKEQFEHSPIEDTLENFYFAVKPSVSADGESHDCPHCGHNTTYFNSDLLYRH